MEAGLGEPGRALTWLAEGFQVWEPVLAPAVIIIPVPALRRAAALLQMV